MSLFELPVEIEIRLKALANAAGHSKSHHACQAVQEYLDDHEALRLVLPLTTSQGFGALGAGTMKRHVVVFLITRRGDGFEARRISAVAIYPCAAMRDAASDEALGRALAEDDGGRVTRLHRRGDLPDVVCWLRGDGWCLTTD